MNHGQTRTDIASRVEELTRDFAIKAHGDQKYDEDKPYVFHLDTVHNVAVELGAPQAVIQATFLHDVLEDTSTDVADMALMFGATITELVVAVTNEPGANRKERNEKTWPKIRDGGDDAVLLKLCDRIANVEHGGPLVKMYQKEHHAFRDFFYPMGSEVAWKRLDAALEVTVKTPVKTAHHRYTLRAGPLEIQANPAFLYGPGPGSLVFPVVIGGVKYELSPEDVGDVAGFFRMILQSCGAAQREER